MLGFVPAILVACFLLIPTGSAFAQGDGLPAICDEYPNLPECQPLPEPPDEEPTDEGPSANNNGGDRDGDGNLPFTGYPLNGLILLLLVLVASGIAIRAGIAARERLVRDPNAP